MLNKNWEKLKTDIKTCTLCEGLNCDELGTQNAPGYGNVNSKVVLIGQSLCGKPCIDSLIPFTGGSGKLLDQAFGIAGIKKIDIYTTNVVKCHPPNNRKSKETEIGNCGKFLKTELDWILPSQIVCLGKDAWAYFDDSIKKASVKEIQLAEQKTNVHFLYHPSYIRRKSTDVQQEYIQIIAEIVTSSIA
jgi:uracil-DNA glycosylase